LIAETLLAKYRQGDPLCRPSFGHAPSAAGDGPNKFQAPRLVIGHAAARASLRPTWPDPVLLTFTDRGIYCPAGDFHIDPWRPVDRALITHGHSDHARPGHGAYLATHPPCP
jgi:hypothetical protein